MFLSLECLQNPSWVCEKVQNVFSTFRVFIDCLDLQGESHYLEIMLNSFFDKQSSY